MASLRGRRDVDGVVAFTEARNRFNELLHSNEVFLEADIEVSLAERRGSKYSLFSCFGLSTKTEKFFWGSSQQSRSVGFKFK